MKLKASCLGLQDPFSAGIMSFPLGAIKKAFSFPSGREGFIAPDISFMRINSWPYNITIYKICQLFLLNCLHMRQYILKIITLPSSISFIFQAEKPGLPKERAVRLFP